jgi:hypothetical protein
MQGHAPTSFFALERIAMIDPEREQVIPISDVPKITPGRPNLSTIWRWRLKGVRGITLETFLSGGKRYTSVEAIRRFQSRVTAAADGEPVRSETPRQRERAIERAEREAERLGV